MDGAGTGGARDLFTALPAGVVDHVRGLVHERSLVSRVVGGTRVETSPLGRDATLVGAAELGFEPVLGAFRPRGVESSETRGSPRSEAERAAGPAVDRSNLTRLAPA